ncbi:MAG: patatin-like phospholipase family protein [Clostridia bacterium]|nr:patatin-like phospholipase family protein [Clostridia bacterium]
MKKFGLALGSSGARGTSYIGFLKALEEEGLKPSYIAGSSMGSVVGACYSLGMSPSQMMDEVCKLKFSQLIDVSLSPVKNAAFLRSNKLIKKLEEYFGEKTFADTLIPFSAVATDLITGKTVVLKDGDLLKVGVAASSAMPTIFKPIDLGDKCLVDGGISCRLPIKEARDLGAEIVIAVDAMGSTRVADKKFNIASVLLRTIDIMDGEINRYRVKKLKPDLVIEPNLGDMSQYKFKNFDFALQAGYEAGKNNIDKIKALIK